jgi:RNA polymerase sigma-70 factor (ECF subfamily)
MTVSMPDANAPLSAAFLSRWPPDAQTGPMADLESALEEAFDKGRAAWPDVDISSDEFAAYLGERCDVVEAPVATLRILHVSDLYLACGCASGSPPAVAALNAKYLSRVAPLLARFDPSPSYADEMTQRLRVFLLVGKDDADPSAEREPKIALYRGRAGLSRWLAIIATRTAISQKKNDVKITALDEVLDVASAESPELELLRRRHLGDFKRLVKDALTDTLPRLTPEARNLLRWHLVENLSLRKIAILRGTNVSAISREYARIRATIRESIVEQLRTRTGLPVQELNSLMTVLISRISLTSGLSMENLRAPSP